MQSLQKQSPSILWNRMSSRKYLHLASTRRFKEILSGGFESNKMGMCDLACTIICPVLSFCYYFQMWNSHSSTILQVKLGQEKTLVSCNHREHLLGL